MRGSLRAAAPLAALLLGGCFAHLRQDNREAEQTGGVLGEISGASSEDAQVLVVAYTDYEGAMEVFAYTPASADTFYMALPSDRDYFLIAFEDHNANLVIDEDERVGAFGTPDPVRVTNRAGAKHTPITLQQGFSLPSEYPRDLQGSGTKLAPTTPLAFGEVVDFDDDRLGERVGRAGLWKPLSTLKSQGAGIYFLEPYDPQRTPVLFVHGTGGYPQQFRYFVEHLDRKRYQPWVFVYPSGLRLDRIAGGMALMLDKLHEKYALEDVAVVAHSMGGLVSRRALMEAKEAGAYVKLFITISTPWNGHEMAKTGVRRAPAVVPAWIDMQSDSDFIQQVFERPLPEGIDYYLIFGFAGTDSVKGKHTDGSVSIASQLDSRAQVEATRIFGLEHGHVDILAAGDTFAIVKDLLDGVARATVGVSVGCPKAAPEEPKAAPEEPKTAPKGAAKSQAPAR